MKPIIVAVLCAAGLIAASSPHAQAAPPVFELPLVCAIPDRCFVEFYVDRAAGPALGDYRCGNRTYDTHRGTDFRVRSPQDFAAGIPVVAAAAGTVVALRDEMEDIDVNELGRDKVAGRASGNTVYLQHDDGWVTQYYHLRRGSIAVRKGDGVVAGQKLGLVGLSGDTNFPHMHFEIRDSRNAIIDPFAGAPATASCTDAGKPLWSAKAMATLAYRNVDAVAGFAARRGTRSDAIYGRMADPPRAGGRLFFWFELFGVERDDTLVVQFALADGTLRPPTEVKIDLPLSYIYRSAGLSAELRPGQYAAILTLKRKGAAIFERRFEIEVK